jgi:uncharacterized protein (TIGR03790 family)
MGYPRRMRLPPVVIASWALAWTLAGVGPAHAQTADNVLVVINTRSAASVEIGELYSRTRNVARDHIARIEVDPAEAVSRADFEQLIETPIAAALGRADLQDRVLYLVLTKGVPLRVTGSTGLNGTIASVDSELTLLYRKMLGVRQPVVGRVPNPYFSGERPIAELTPFTRASSDIYLVTRLDGFTGSDVRKLIEQGASPAQNGQIVLDRKATAADAGGDRWLDEAATRLRDAGATDRVLLETSPQLAATTQPVLGYYSWGSNDPANQQRRFGFRFSPGAIGGMFVSTDGRTFAEPPQNWTPSPPSGGPNFGGSFQSLAGDLIRDGITGVAAHVAEPYLDATIRPQILFPAYLGGANLAEAFYASMPYLSWQTVVIGDPLTAPFRSRVVPDAELHRGMDPETNLPAVFTERRLALLMRRGLNAEGVKLLLKADGARLRGNLSDAQALLEQATLVERRLTSGHLLLAELYQQQGEHAKAIARFRQVLAVEPQHVVALNDLAYALATHERSYPEALRLAEQAYRLSPIPLIADTVGWIHHLAGDDQAAIAFLAKAAMALPNHAEIRWHTGIVYAALKDAARAREELRAAERLDPKLASREETRALRTQLEAIRPAN